jgi:hypothetical protein
MWSCAAMAVWLWEPPSGHSGRPGGLSDDLRLQADARWKVGVVVRSCGRSGRVDLTIRLRSVVPALGPDDWQHYIGDRR